MQKSVTLQMVFLKLVHTEYQVNHKTQLFWVKVVHISANSNRLIKKEVFEQWDVTFISEFALNTVGKKNVLKMWAQIQS